MKKPLVISSLIFLVIVLAGLFVWKLTQKDSILAPSVTVEHLAPSLISDEAWRASIYEDPTAHGYSGYGILQDRNSDAAIDEGLRDLKSEDAYVWMNAASYLGSRSRKEAVPYLIKALRHTAWRSDGERVEFLEALTGQTFGNDFDQWRRWYESQPDAIELDWETSLGYLPRLPETEPAPQVSERKEATAVGENYTTPRK